MFALTFLAKKERAGKARERGLEQQDENRRALNVKKWECRTLSAIETKESTRGEEGKTPVTTALVQKVAGARVHGLNWKVRKK